MSVFKCITWTTRLDKILGRVQPGDTVLFHRGLFIHHAIYVGDGRAIHHHLGPSDGEVIEVTLEYLAKGDLMRVMRVTDTSFSPEEVIRRARSQIGPLPYSLHGGNCEHFTSWVYYGVRESRQLSGLCRFELRLLQYVKHHGGEKESQPEQQQQQQQQQQGMSSTPVADNCCSNNRCSRRSRNGAAVPGDSVMPDVSTVSGEIDICAQLINAKQSGAERSGSFAAFPGAATEAARWLGACVMGASQANGRPLSKAATVTLSKRRESWVEEPVGSRMVRYPASLREPHMRALTSSWRRKRSVPRLQVHVSACSPRTSSSLSQTQVAGLATGRLKL